MNKQNKEYDALLSLFLLGCAYLYYITPEEMEELGYPNILTDQEYDDLKNKLNRAWPKLMVDFDPIELYFELKKVKKILINFG